MDATTLRDAVHDFFPKPLIKAAIRRLGVQMRDRKRDLSCLLAALVMTAGSDDSGRQADVFEAYLEEAEKEVVRGAFYAWFTDALAALMKELLAHAMETVWEQPPRLTGRLAKVGVKDWIVVDSETVSLPDELAEIFPATSKAAGLKVHKYISLGRNNVIDIEITPARDHDAPVLRLDERWCGMGLIVDLGYVSLALIRECQRLDILLVIRLKKGWKPRMLRTVDELGELLDIDGEPVLDNLLDMASGDYDGSSFDFDVAFGQGKRRVTARLVGVPGPGSYHWCITLLPREAATPELVQMLYRARWEIELDNKRDKGGARLDQIRGRKRASVLVLVYASLIRTMLANHLVYIDLRDRPPTRAPLHGMAVALALNICANRIVDAMETDDPRLWRKAARAIRARGHDPNWRRRPSVLDQLRGISAPPGRPRKSRQRDCPPSALPYRQPPEPSR
jgi:putative transposase